MAHGVSKGFIDDTFSARIDELEKLAHELATQFRKLDSYRPWATPNVFTTERRDTLDVPALDEPSWNRNNINSGYSEDILKGPGEKGGTVGDLIALKWQTDFMAVEERAFRLRHASYARCAAFMHGRLDGHGADGVGVFSFFRDGVESAIALGRSHGAADPREENKGTAV
jgi:hypothetical protein